MTTHWQPQIDLESLNRAVVELEQVFLSFLQKEKPLKDLFNLPALKQIYGLVDTDPWQAFLFARIKNAHSMTPRHGINVMLMTRAWCILKHRMGSKLDELSFAALVHDAGHWYHGDLVYVFSRYTFEQADELRLHCLQWDWDDGTLTENMKTWIGNHHENHNGTGYPQGISEPPLLSQILRIVDCFEGLTTKRHFRPSHSYFQALEKMKKWTPYKFHPGLMKSWEELLGEYPPGTGLILRSGEIAVSLPGTPAGAPPHPISGPQSHCALVLKHEDGEHKIARITPIENEAIKSETVAYFQPPLPEEWHPLRPDNMELRRNYLEENETESDKDL